MGRENLHLSRRDKYADALNEDERLILSQVSCIRAWTKYLQNTTEPQVKPEESIVLTPISFDESDDRNLAKAQAFVGVLKPTVKETIEIEDGEKINVYFLDPTEFGLLIALNRRLRNILPYINHSQSFRNEQPTEWL